MTHRAAAVGGLVFAGLVVTGCGGPAAGPGQTPVASPTTTSTAVQQALVVADPWVRSTDGPGMQDMSALFGVLRNPSPTEVKVTGGRSDVAGRIELHETVKGPDGTPRMQPKAGGFTVPAGGSLTLAPGGSHVMLMDLKAPIRAGTEVAVILTTSAADVPITAPARAFAGGQETYVPTPARP